MSDKLPPVSALAAAGVRVWRDAMTGGLIEDGLQIKSDIALIAYPAPVAAAIVAAVECLDRLGEAVHEYAYWSERDTGGGAESQYNDMKARLIEARLALAALREVAT